VKQSGSLYAKTVTAVIWCIIGAGVLIIFISQGVQMHARYASEGLVTESLMLIILGGIPSIAFAGIVHVGLSWLLLRNHKGPLTTTYTAEILPPKQADHSHDNLID
jgi:hypothetical protein